LFPSQILHDFVRFDNWRNILSEHLLASIWLSRKIIRSFTPPILILSLSVETQNLVINISRLINQSFYWHLGISKFSDSTQTSLRFGCLRRLTEHSLSIQILIVSIEISPSFPIIDCVFLLTEPFFKENSLFVRLFFLLLSLCNGFSRLMKAVPIQL
jgi:hypothetical protein